MKRQITVLLAVMSLGGCVSLFPDSGDQPPRIRLDADAPVTTAEEFLPVSLVIDDPSAEAVYNTFNVAVATSPYQFEYLDGAEWADRVPVLFRIYLERRFENSGYFRAVGDRTELPIGAGYVLHTDIRAFHLDQSRWRERALVSFGARIADSRGRTLATDIFAADSETELDGRRSYDRALNRSAQIASERVILWAVEVIEAAEAEKADHSK